MEPTPKAKAIDETLKELGLDRKQIRKNRCTLTGCERSCEPEDFHDELSRNEYRISGLCQYHQDWLFGNDRLFGNDPED